MSGGQISNLKIKGQTGSQVYEGWKAFLFQFSNFLLAFGHSEAEDKKKVALLLHMLGPEVIHIYNSFNLGDSTKVKYADLVKKFENFFSPKKNVSLERHTFFTRKQKAGESIESYVTDLKVLAGTCEFKELKDSLVKDVFIVGLLEENKHIKERLLQEGDEKKLDEIVDIARTIEMSRTKDNILTSQEVMKIGKKTNSYSTNHQKKKSCGKCGQIHEFNRCPADKAKCHGCSRRGHYFKMCRFKHNVSTVKENCKSEHSENSSYFIGSVSKNMSGKDKWNILACINRKFVPMCIDTGAEANVLSLNDFKLLGLPGSVIKQTMSKLTNYGGSEIPIVGQCILDCEINNRKIPTRFFICNSDQPNILGLKSSEIFELIKKICHVGNSDFSKFGSYSSVMGKYSDIFNGLGCLPGECHITLKDNAQPHVDPPRRIPFKLMTRYKAELERMCSDKVIEKVTKPTQWVNSVVLTEKPDKSLRVCLDPQHLNQEILRPRYQLPTLEDIRSKLTGASYFSKLDASSAFWSICLDKESSDLCTFISPFGRFKFLRMPYGLCCAPEKFQQKMVELLSELDGVIVYIDDVLIFGKNKSEHDHRLIKVLDRVRKINLKLNVKKCEIGLQKIKFLGQNFECSGMSPEMNKVDAIQNMPQPTCVKDLQRFLGMVNYLANYLPNMSEKSVNLRKLLKKSNLWCWEDIHTKEFTELKNLICKAPILSYYDVRKPIVLTVDASKDAVGACILQAGKPIAYASKSLTETQKRWAQIEKELFAIWFGCSRFHQYVYGQLVTVETDHKPLINIFKKALADIPNRLQRIMMKLQMYHLNVNFKSGKEMYISDTLSRAALSEKCTEFDESLEQELSVHANLLFRSLNVSDQKLVEICEKTKLDNALQGVIKYINSGWPRYCKAVPDEFKGFYKVKDDLHLINGVIFKNNCIVIPKVMQNAMLKDIHESHMGFDKTKVFVRDVIFWPGLFHDLKLYIESCEVCQKYKPSNPKEPLISHEMPSHPWEKIACDLFEFDKNTYLLMVDYYSRFFEVARLNNSTSETIKTHMKSIFARQGVPALLISDRGPPFTSNDLKSFYKEWNINFQWSSPYYPKSNGLVEQTVKLVKNTLIKCQEGGNDPYLAMLHLRNACQFGQEAPSKLLNARLLRTNIPIVKNMLKTKPVSSKKYRQNAESRMRISKNNYDKYSKSLPPLSLKETVWFQKKPGTVWLPAEVSKLPSDLNSFRAYEIITPEGKVFVRNRVYLRKRKVKNNNCKPNLSTSSNNSCIENNSDVILHNTNYDFEQYLYSGMFNAEAKVVNSTIETGTEIVVERPTDLGGSPLELETELSESLLVNVSLSPEVRVTDPEDSFSSYDSTESTLDDTLLDPTWEPNK